MAQKNTNWRETTRKINGVLRKVAVRMQNGKEKVKLLDKETKKPKQHSAPVRCMGMNEDGSRCENMTTDIPEFCHIHQGQAHRTQEEWNEPTVSALKDRYETAKREYKLAGEMLRQHPDYPGAEEDYRKKKHEYKELGEALARANKALAKHKNPSEAIEKFDIEVKDLD